MLKGIPAAALLSSALWAAPADDREKQSGAVYELRIYHVASGKLPELLARFRDHTITIFNRHAIESIAYWTPTDDPQKDKTLIYILRHQSREGADANWKSFRDDAEWKSVKEKSEANGPLVDKVDSTFMVMTDFSPRIVSKT